MDVLAELEARGLVHQATDLDGLREHLRAPRRVYCGFDPTAPSLTLGNLVPIIIMAHLQRGGHTPVVVLGGATGLIGDPSGKSAERQLLDPAAVAANLAGQRRVFDAVLDCHPDPQTRPYSLTTASGCPGSRSWTPSGTSGSTFRSTR
jgi:tyrosyl-tRNA synthetase